MSITFCRLPLVVIATDSIQMCNLRVILKFPLRVSHVFSDTCIDIDNTSIRRIILIGMKTIIGCDFSAFSIERCSFDLTSALKLLCLITRNLCGKTKAISILLNERTMYVHQHGKAAIFDMNLHHTSSLPLSDLKLRNGIK